jgi:hypothetical protein
MEFARSARDIGKSEGGSKARQRAGHIVPRDSFVVVVVVVVAAMTRNRSRVLFVELRHYSCV